MVDHDPYQPPADVVGGDPMGRVRKAGKSHTETMVDYLQATRPWVILLAILGFIGAAFMALGGMFMLIGILAGGSIFGDSADGMGDGMFVVMSMIYLFGAGVYVYVSLLLLRYASSIGNLVATGESHFLEEALLRQKTFWKAMGIMAIVGIGLMIAAGVVGVIAAAVTATSGG